MVTATGSAPLTYQWRHNGMDLTGATSASLTVQDVEPADLGQYVVTVSNAAGSVRSRPAHIDVGSNPNAVSRSKFEDLSRLGGGSPQFGQGRRQNITVGAGILGTQVINNTGSVTEAEEPIHGLAIGGSSRWFELTADADGTMLVDTISSDIDTTLAVYTGSTLATLSLIAQDNNGAPDGVRSLVAFDAEKDTTYLVAVDGVDGATGVINLNWILGDPPVITAGPIDLQANRLESVMFFGTATGNPAPTFSWQLNGVDVMEETESTLSIAEAAPEDAGIYTLVAANVFGTASASALLIVDNPLRFIGAPGLQPDGSFAVTLVGPENANAGISIVLEASPDFETWTQVATATSMNGMFELMEEDASGKDFRFYRVRLNTGQ